MIQSDSRRGSLVPNGSRRGSGQRSRCGSISLGGVERRGSYYSEDVSKRSTVAVVVDDPEGKKQMTNALKGVFDEHDGECFDDVAFSHCLLFQLILRLMQNYSDIYSSVLDPLTCRNFSLYLGCW